MDVTNGNPVDQPRPAGRAPERYFDTDVKSLKARLVREATSAVAMLESALEALWKLDREAAQDVKRRDDRIDAEEVAIEESCLRLMALQQPFARDFRLLTFVLKANADLERVADHASAIAKAIRKLPSAPPEWPTALVDLAQRVPIICHQLIRALLDEDIEAAKAIVAGDKTIDAINRRLFDETLEMMKKAPGLEAHGLLVYRIGRDLERIGDLMTNLAEDIVYLRTGSIVRHEKKLAKAQERQQQQQS